MYNIDDMIYNCPVEALSNILGKKWVAIIIWKIQEDKNDLESYKELYQTVVRKC